MNETDETEALSEDTDVIVSVLVDALVTAAVLYGSHARDEVTQQTDVDLSQVLLNLRYQ